MLQSLKKYLYSKERGLWKLWECIYVSPRMHAHVHRKGFVCNVLQRDGNLILFAFIYIHLRARIIAFDVKYVPHTIRKYVPNVWSSNHHKGGINSTSIESLTATKYRKLSLSYEISLEFISVIIQLE